MTQHGTGIEWTHLPRRRGESWNPVVGCSVISPGCTNCYAMKFAARLLDRKGGPAHYRGTTQASKAGAVWTGQVNRARDEIMTQPLRWRAPRAVFVNSLGDLFHESVPDAWIDQVFAVMALCPQHIFIVLTKRAERMRDYLEERRYCRGAWVVGALAVVEDYAESDHQVTAASLPLPNVWLGVSAEDQQRWDERVPVLRRTPAAVRLVSAEPLIGEIQPNEADELIDEVHWIICGGESGRGARPMHPAWARVLRDYSTDTGSRFFFKQWGDWAPTTGVTSNQEAEPGSLIPHTNIANGKRTYHAYPYNWSGSGPLEVMCDVGKHAAGRTLDGRTHDAFPAILGAGQ